MNDGDSAGPGHDANKPTIIREEDAHSSQIEIEIDMSKICCLSMELELDIRGAEKSELLDSTYIRHPYEIFILPQPQT